MEGIWEKIRDKGFYAGTHSTRCVLPPENFVKLNYARKSQGGHALF